MTKRWTGWLIAVASALTLMGCGGGGGDSGDPVFGGGDGDGGTPGSQSVTVQLVDSAGEPISPPALSGSQSATMVVTVVDSAGNSLPGELVAVSGEAVTFTPSSGQQLTDSNGVARFQVQSSDPFAGGATVLAASVAEGGEGQLAVALGGASATVGALTASTTTVGAYEAIQVSVPVTLDGTTTPAAQLPVTFSASCGVFDPEQAVTDLQGIARSTYRNQSGNTACSGNVTLSAQVGSDSSAVTVAAVAPAAANIQFVTATPSRIYLAGSPGVSQSIVSFKLIDNSGNPVAGQAIDLSLSLRPDGVYLGSTVGTSALRQSTGADGTVAVAVNAGTSPGPVQIAASLASDASIRNVSNTLAVASGLPAQKAFSLSVSTFNIEALTRDGVETTITLRVADRLGNPVPDGSTINFIAEGGQVVASCNTDGASAGDTSGCSVVLSSQNPRPSNGRVTVLAWAQGEETFVDSGLPTNNVYDAGESFEELGQPYLDKDEDGVFDNGTDVTVGTASGALACPTAPTISAPSTCNGVWAGGALVRAQAYIVFSGSDPFFTNVARTGSGGRCTVAFTMKDENGNPLPAGTTLGVGDIVGGGAPDEDGNPTAATFAGFGGEGATVPNTSNVANTRHSAVFSECPNLGQLQFTLTVVTPGGKRTSVFF